MTFLAKPNLHALRRDTSGATVAEAAVILPLVFFLLLGILWFGRAYQIYSTVNRAAREAAQAAAVPTCATCGNATPTKASIQSNVVNPILTAAHLDPAMPGLAFNMNAGYPSAIPLNSSSPQEYGYSATLSYPYNFTLYGVTCCPPALVPITTGITITGQAQARQEN